MVILSSRASCRAWGAAAHILRLQLQTFEVSSPEEIPDAFAAMERSGVRAVLLRGDPLVLDPYSRQSVTLALKHRLAVIYPWPHIPVYGGLMSLQHQYQRASPTLSILRGPHSEGRQAWRSPHRAAGQTKKDVAAFFQDCTTENVRWRQTIKRKLEMAAGSNEFIRLTQLALSYGVGKPIPMQPVAVQRQALYFVTSKGLPWENDPLAAKEKELLAAQEADDLRDQEQRALEAARPPSEGPDGEGEMELVRNPWDR